MDLSIEQKATLIGALFLIVCISKDKNLKN
jgi:hypothetical protein